jgi:hypothetical protein
LFRVCPLSDGIEIIHHKGHKNMHGGLRGCPCGLSGKIEVHVFLIFFSKTRAFGVIKNFERANRIWA